MASIMAVSNFSLTTSLKANIPSLARSSHVISLKKQISVKCEAQPNPTETTETPKLTPENPFIPPSAPASPFIKKESTEFGDIFAFTGPAPEIINGRLAMLGFVVALGVEVASGSPLLGQLSNPASISWFLFSVSLISVASLIPLFQGIYPKSMSSGFFSSNAEVWNGRAAMVGLVALAVTEYLRGSALF